MGTIDILRTNSDVHLIVDKIYQVEISVIDDILVVVLDLFPFTLFESVIFFFLDVFVRIVEVVVVFLFLFVLKS